MLLCTFSNTLEVNNGFVRDIPSRATPGGTPPAGIFARHDYQPKATSLEQSVWGSVSGRGVFRNNWEKLVEGKQYNLSPADRNIDGNKQNHYPSSEKTINGNYSIHSIDSTYSTNNFFSNLVITDPPYVGNVNYSELSDFFYVWLRLVLKDQYLPFRARIHAEERGDRRKQDKRKKQAGFFRRPQGSLCQNLRIHSGR